ncbi:unnamed protein product [Microthlaspi erraticum]|uniref:Protein kinase domain-containing protein n=1 Tax=Microthlaspi erraticum TaxID=1685480 RepID=A0A6D2HYM2_9BRAS|nr:unnamed protein product [Microthlaspi erraticum]
MMQSNEEFVRFHGEGAYGYVHLVRYTNPDGSSFSAAVNNSYSADYDSLQRELQILRKLRGCPRIVKCFGDNLEQGLSSYGNKVHKLLLEYALGSLNAFMENYIYTDRKLPESMIKDFTRMILQEVGQVPDYWEIDFPFVGTLIYMPPESLRDGVAKKTLDLWSVGCIVLEMHTGVIPWEGVKLGDLTTRLRDGKAPEMPQSLPCEAKEFIETCFSRNHEEREEARVACCVTGF